MKVWLVALILLLATACGRTGDEPGQDDIRAALKQAGYRGGPQAEKLACKTSPERPGVICDYRAPACNRFTGTCGPTRPFTGRFLRAGGRWQLVEDLTPRAQQDPVTQPLPGVVLATPTATPTATPAEPAPDAIPTASADEPFPESAPGPRDDPPAFDPPNDPGDAPLSVNELGQAARWLSLNTRCRLGRPGALDTEMACDERDQLTRRMERRGLCNIPGRGWRRCD